MKIWSRLSAKRYDIVALVALLAVVGAVFFYSVNLPPGKIIFAPDIWRYHYFVKPFLAQQLTQGTIPLWNPFVFAGQPYIEHPQVTPWYLPLSLFMIFPVPLAVTLYFGLHIFIAMAGMYFFLRSIRLPMLGGIGRWQAWIASVCFGLSAVFVARIYAGHMDVIAASSWIPWVFFAFSRLYVKPTPNAAVLAGVAIAIQIFAGYQTIALFTLEAVGLLSMIVAISQKSFRPVLWTLGSFLIGFGLSAIQILPSQQFVRYSIRTLTLPDAWSTVGTPTPWHLVELLDPTFFYSMLPYVSLGHEYASYIGKTPLLFVFLALIWIGKRRVRSPYILFFIALCILAWWIAFAGQVPVDLWWLLQKYVPYYGQLRIPARHLVLFAFGLSGLAGIGFALEKRKIVLGLITILVLVDLVPFAWKNIVIGDIPELAEDQALISLVKSQGSEYRMLPLFYGSDSPRESFESLAPMKYEVYSLAGYDSPPLKNYFEFHLALSRAKLSDIGPYTESIPPYLDIHSPFTNTLNVKYLFVPSWADPLDGKSSEQFVLVKENLFRKYRIYENKNVLPRFFTVPTLTVKKDRSEVSQAIWDRTFDPTQEVLVEQRQIDRTIETDCGPDEHGEVKINSYSSNAISLSLSMPCNGVLTSSEVMYPGWKAYVDGKEVPVLEGNLAFRTIFLSEGTHEVVFRYLPDMLYIGGVISAVTALACFVVITKVLLFVE